MKITKCADGMLKLIPIIPTGDTTQRTVSLRIHFYEDEYKSIRLTSSSSIFDNLDRELRLFTAKEVRLFDPRDYPCMVISNPHFKFPRFKKANNNKFIFSMLYNDGVNMCLGVGRFEGEIPRGYSVLKDRIKYPRGYWN